ncbi:hypothetical protein FGG08_002816 [Glutinoglossum americanum]|uniref:Uncharacterized protein n=1 Tax=Glutinoglossum americanum TaxID=1670608 RepID=A0A9P8HZK5_9PEZI|nr:hypothetical protein FGG08_002816 [Glutinoglossum americanum]
MAPAQRRPQTNRHSHTERRSAEYFMTKIKGPILKVEKSRAPAMKKQMNIYAGMWKRFCLETQIDENDVLACGVDDLESGKAQIYEVYLEWILFLGGIQYEESLITNWYYIRMLHRNKNQERDIGSIIWKHISNTYDVKQYATEQYRVQMIFMLHSLGLQLLVQKLLSKVLV